MEITIVDKITREEFYKEFVNKSRPVVIKNMASSWKALDWSKEYFKNLDTDIKVPVKTKDITKGNKEQILLSDYIGLLEEHENDQNNNGKPPAMYLHDYPFFYQHKQFIKDIEPFPVELLPKWYSKNYENYIQFFMGGKNSLTPLHFDTLCTHNLFFQIMGKKKFILIPHDQKEDCYMDGWRWAKFDPSQPDYSIFPNSKNVESMEVVIEGGDILYIPSGMLHQVHGLSYSISFNIDWHTPSSAFKGIRSILKGAPLQNLYYNFLIFLGVTCKVSPKAIFKYYKSYLNYTS